MTKIETIKLNNEAIKYSFLNSDGTRLTYNEFINLLSSKDESFLEKFRSALDDATSKFKCAYLWECIPVSKGTIGRNFEFVAVKSTSLNSVRQNYSSFADHIDRNRDKYACSFPNLGRDSILIVPTPQFCKEGQKKYLLDYKNISQFTKNAPKEQQYKFWQEVGNKMKESLNENEAPKWLSTHGLGVYYLHVRIDKFPKYYHWEEYREAIARGL
jgi:hypothetical protein